MILHPIRFRRPDLKDEVQELVTVIGRAGDEGRHVPLIELVRILGINVTEAFREQIEARGNLALSDGTFENAGPEIHKTVRLLGMEVDMVIAERLVGRLDRFSDSFVLAFEPDHTVTLTKFLFRARLRHLDISGTRVFVDFAGAQDVFIDMT